MAIILKLTNAGRTALINNEQTGTTAKKVVSVGVTETAFTFDADMAAIPAEHKRITTIGGRPLNEYVIHSVVMDSTQDSYTVRGFGLYLEDGVLLGVYAQEQPIIEKSTQAVMLLQLDLMLVDAGLTANNITFGDVNFINPPATETDYGVVRLSTLEEAIAGTIKSNVAITPYLLHYIIHHKLPQASKTQYGIGRLATLEEALAGTLEDNVLITPATLNAVMMCNGVPIGAVLPFAAPALPPGYLRANGGYHAPDLYPELFAVLGYSYGQSGNKFRVPESRANALRFMDDGRGIDINRQLGSEQSDAQRDWSIGLHDMAGGTVGNMYGTLCRLTRKTGLNHNAPSGSNTFRWMDAHFSPSNGGLPVASENRMRNIAFYGLIKAYTTRNI